jgi:hypothetical protein
MLAVLTLGLLLSPAAFADPPADKGKGQSAAQPAGQGDKNQSSHDHGHESDASAGKGNDKSKNKSRGDPDNWYDPYDDKYQGSKSDANHGQRVSECNHRANSKQVKGQERKEYVEWCIDNGERYKYDDRRWTSSRTCYQKADDRNLSGDARRLYINSCLTNTIFK